MAIVVLPRESSTRKKYFHERIQILILAQGKSARPKEHHNVRTKKCGTATLPSMFSSPYVSSECPQTDIATLRISSWFHPQRLPAYDPSTPYSQYTIPQSGVYSHLYLVQSPWKS